MDLKPEDFTKPDVTDHYEDWHKMTPKIEREGRVEFDTRIPGGKPVEKTEENAWLTVEPKLEKDAQQREDDMWEWILKNSDDPEETMARMRASNYLAKQHDLDPNYVYDNLEDLTKEYFGQSYDGTTAWKYIKNGWTIGKLNDQLMDLSYAKMQSIGTPQEEKIQAEIDALKGELPSYEDQKKSWGLEKVRNAATVLPGMFDTLADGVKQGLLTAMGAGGAAAVVGQLGPQAMVPEEALSVPAFTGAGYMVGSTIGSAESSFKKMAGASYMTLMEEPGMTEETARGISYGVGVASASVEMVQLSSIPGVGPILGNAMKKAIGRFTAGAAADAAAQTAAKTVTKKVAQGAGKYAAGVFANAGEEALQEIIQMAGQDIAANIDNVEDEKKVWQELDQAFEVGKEALFSFALISAPGTAISPAASKIVTQLRERPKNLMDSEGNAIPTTDQEMYRPQENSVLVDVEDIDPPSQVFSEKLKEYKIAKEQYDTAQAGEGAISPIKVIQTEDGYVPATEYDAAMLQVTQEAGEAQVMTEIIPSKEDSLTSPDSENTIENQDAIESDTENLKADWEMTPREFKEKAEVYETEKSDFMEVQKLADFEANLEKAVPDTTPEERSAIVTLMEYKAVLDKKSPTQYIQEHFAPEVFTRAPVMDQEGNLAQGYKAAAAFLEDGKALIHITDKSDFSSIIHEYGHVVRKDIGQADQEILLDHYGKTEWDVESEEQFVKDFEDYLMFGRVPNMALKNLFQRIKDGLEKIWNRIGRNLPEKQLPNEVRQVFDRIFTGDVNKAKPRGLGAQRETYGMDDSLNDIIFQKVKGPLYQTEAYHGSPNSFKEFLLDYIGSENGAEYGWGLYFAEKQAQAALYADTDPSNMMVDGIPVNDLPRTEWEAYADTIKYGGIDEALEHLEQIAGFESKPRNRERTMAKIEWINANREKIHAADKNMYQVTLNPGRKDTWLSWNDPFPRELKAHVKKEMAYSGLDPVMGGLFNSTGVTGKAIYEAITEQFKGQTGNNILNAKKATSQLLKRCGIDGNKYPGNAFGMGDGSDGWNYVMFSDDVRINSHILFQPEELTNRALEKKPELKAKLDQFQGTAYARMTGNTAAFWEAIDSVADGATVDDIIKEYGQISPQAESKLREIFEAVAKNGKEGLWDYTAKSGLLGGAKKPGTSVNGLFSDCNPSKNCAKYCYACKSNYVYTNVMTKQELVGYVVKTWPDRAADRLAAEYKLKYPSNWENRPLRLFDRGDISKEWLPVIEQLNEKGIPTHIFSKRPEILSKVDKSRNTVLLSIDNSNVELAREYPDLPLALVYEGDKDIPILEEFKDQIQVILPVREGGKIIAGEIQENLIKKAKELGLNNNLCPVDAGRKKLSEGVCESCLAGSGIGCYHNNIPKAKAQNIDKLASDIFAKIGALSDEEKRQFAEVYRGLIEGDLGREKERAIDNLGVSFDRNSEEEGDPHSEPEITERDNSYEDVHDVLFQDSEHEEIVRKAVEEFKPVPDTVLQEYRHTDWAQREFERRDFWKKNDLMIQFAVGFDSWEELKAWYEDHGSPVTKEEMAKLKTKDSDRYYKEMWMYANRKTREENNAVFIKQYATKEGVIALAGEIASDPMSFGRGSGIPGPLYTLKSAMRGRNGIQERHIRAAITAVKNNPTEIRQAFARAQGDEETLDMMLFEEEMEDMIPLDSKVKDLDIKDRWAQALETKDPELRNALLAGEVSEITLQDMYEAVNKKIKRLELENTKQKNALKVQIQEEKKDGLYAREALHRKIKEAKFLKDAVELEKLELVKNTQAKMRGAWKKRRETELLKERMRSLAYDISRPPSKFSVHVDHQKMILALQRFLDPNFRRKSRAEAWKERDEFYKQYPGVLDVLSKDDVDKIVAKPLNYWTLDELIDLHEKIAQLRLEGRQALEEEEADRQRQIQVKAFQMAQEIGHGHIDGAPHVPHTDHDPVFRDWLKTSNKDHIKSMSWRPSRILKNLGGASDFVDGQPKVLEEINSSVTLKADEKLGWVEVEPRDIPEANVMKAHDDVRLQGLDYIQAVALDSKGKDRSVTLPPIGKNYGKTITITKSTNAEGKITIKSHGGNLVDYFWNQINQHTDAELKMIHQRHEAMFKTMKDLGLSMKGLHRLVDGPKGKYTVDDIIQFYIVRENEKNMEALEHGIGLSPVELHSYYSQLTEKEIALADAIAKDFEDNYQRYADVYAKDKNEIMGKVEGGYFPMRRQKLTANDHSEEIARDITASMGVGRASPKHSGTHSRQTISAEHQDPIKLGAMDLWMQEVVEQEHYINSRMYIKEMQSIINTPVFQQAVVGQHGKRMMEWFNRYSGEFARPTLYKMYDATTNLSKVLRNHTAIAYLSWNMLTVAKQFPSVGMFLGRTGPVVLTVAAAKFASNPRKCLDFVNERDPQMKDRSIDRVMEEMKYIREANWDQEKGNIKKLAKSSAEFVRKIGEAGMAPITWVDKMATTIGWMAVYDQNVKTKGEEEAIRLAQEAVLETQPAARAKDLAEMYRSGEGINWFIMFTNQINQQWNIVTSDIPSSLGTALNGKDHQGNKVPAKVRQVEFQHAMGTVAGLMMSFAGIAVLSGWKPWKEDDPEDIALSAGWMFGKAMMNLTPFVGSNIVSGADGWMGSGTDPVPLANAVGRFIKSVPDMEDRDKMLSVLGGVAEGAGVISGTPFMPVKRSLKAGKALVEGEPGNAALEFMGVHTDGDY